MTDVGGWKLIVHRMRQPGALAVASAILLLIAFWLPAESAASEEAGFRPRIIGGRPAASGTYPWAAALVISGFDALNGQFCGGTLVAPDYVLTAAHCVEGLNPAAVEVVLGRVDLTANDGERIGIQRIFIHPQYNASSHSADLALIRLARPSIIEPVELLSEKLADELSPGTIVTVVGWGTTRFTPAQGSFDPSSVLMEVQVPVVSNRQCTEAYGPLITPEMLCAGTAGKDSCQGDSGGPLLLFRDGKFLLSAIVSFGEGCALADFPGVYTRILEYRDWITAIALPAGSAPTRFHWNGAFGMHNVISIYNRGSEALSVRATLFDSEGAVQGVEVRSIGGLREVDLLVNLMAGFSADGIGTVSLDFGGPSLDANGFQYRFNGEEIEFMKGKPLPLQRTGPSFLIFNALQPSYSLEDQGQPVNNWLELANHNPLIAERYTLRFYDLSGARVAERIVMVPANGRRDLPVGDSTLPVGMVELIPEDPSGQYSAQISRYGFTAAQPMPTFASAASAVSPSTDAVYASITAGAGALNWVTVANASDSDAVFVVELSDQFAGPSAQLELFLPAKAQTHVPAHAYLAPGSSGVVKAAPLTTAAVVLESAVYFPDTVVQGRVLSSYLSIGASAKEGLVFSSYNLFLRQFNWLKSFNVSDEPSGLSAVLTSYSVNLFNAPLLLSTEVGLAPLHGADIGFHQLALAAPENVLGPLSLDPKKGKVVAGLQRVQFSPAGAVQAAEFLELR